MNSIRKTTKAHASRRKQRLVAVVGAALSAVLIWLLADKTLGIDLHQPAFGAGAAQPLPLVLAGSLAGLLALLGWASLAILERFNPRRRRIWLFAALGALVLSLGNPLSGHGVTSANRLALVCMHLVAGAIVIPLLYRGSKGPAPAAAA